jgi:hypothetical protein
MDMDITEVEQLDMQQEETDWSRLAAKQFLTEYSATDSLYNNFHDTSLNEIISTSLTAFERLPIDRSLIPQERLDLVNRTRTSLFPWRGQFSPELVEIILKKYSHPDSVIADPFVGSGTTVFEASQKSLSCFGAEINPAAVAMAQTVHFGNLTSSERKNYFRDAQRLLEVQFPLHQIGGLFALLSNSTENDSSSIEDALKELLAEASQDPFIYTIIANVLIHFTSRNSDNNGSKVFGSLKEYQTIVEQLPYSKSPCQVFHCDARTLPIYDDTVDLVITSPPYINVFNYHQNYRSAMELAGWKMLQVARSEFGSNRKNRGNRFLTVIQYAMDILQALHEMRRVIRPDGRIVIIVGRESNVRGISFQNGKIVAALATGGANLCLQLRQERKFKNKFGKIIYEDILHLVPGTASPSCSDNFAWRLGQTILQETLELATGDVHSDILAAIYQAPTIKASPVFQV